MLCTSKDAVWYIVLCQLLRALLIKRNVCVSCAYALSSADRIDEILPMHDEHFGLLHFLDAAREPDNKSDLQRFGGWWQRRADGTATIDGDVREGKEDASNIALYPLTNQPLDPANPLDLHYWTCIKTPSTLLHLRFRIQRLPDCCASFVDAAAMDIFYQA